MAEYRIIDISGWNTNVPYNKLASYGIKGAIFRITEKGNITDSMFEKHVQGIKSVGLTWVGVYKFSYALSVLQIQTEANAVVKVLRNHPEFNGVVFLDLEYDKQASLGKAMLTQMINAFKSIIIESGYKFGIYSNQNWRNNYLDMNVISDDYWVASYPLNDNGTLQERIRPKFNHLKGWQFTESFLMDGQKYDMSVFDKAYIDNINTIAQVNKVEVKDLAPVTKEEVVYNINRGTSADDILNIFRGWLGLSRINGSHRVIIDTYNSYLPHPRGYAVTYTDDYCATTVSAAFVKANAVNLIGGIECSVERIIENCFKPINIWIEDEKIIPIAGDIICFNWGNTSAQNTGWADHIGIVEYVEGNTIHTIEGNTSGGIVARRQYPIGYSEIRGYARPKYGSDASTITTVEEVPVPNFDPVLVIEEPIQASEQPSDLTPRPIQQTIQSIQTTMSTTHTGASTNTSGIPSKERKFYGVIVADVLNIRTYAGTQYPRLTSYPQLPYGTVVEVCDQVPANDGVIWYYIRIDNSVYGFASSEYIQKK